VRRRDLLDDGRVQAAASVGCRCTRGDDRARLDRSLEVTNRDRIILCIFVVVGLMAAAWYVGLAPKQKVARDLDTQIAGEEQKLTDARRLAGEGETARARYDANYAAVVALGKAVPTGDDMPSLMSQIQSAATGARVDFQSIGIGAGTASGTSASAPAASASEPGAASTLPPGAVVGSAGFPTMPLTFTFEGSYLSLQRFLGKIQRFVRVHGDQVAVDGRLVSIDGFSLAIGGTSSSGITASLTATTYFLPAEQGSAAGASAPDSAAAGATPASPSTAGGATGGSTSATTTATATTGVK